MADGGYPGAETAGALVRRHRVAAGLTQHELAARAGVGVGTVRDLEQGRVTRPRARVLDQLAAALGLGSGQRADLAAAAAGLAGRPGKGLTGRPGQPGKGLAGRPGKGLWLRVLGTVGCWHDGAPASLGPARQRAVAALLAVQPNTAVHRETLIDALWPDGPPGSAVAVVQSHVSRLRKILDGGPDGRPGSAVLISTGTSYRLDVGPDELDLLAFRQFAAQARRAAGAGDPAGACRQFEQALELWEGEPLGDVAVLAGHPAVTGLTQLRAGVIAEYAQIAAETGLAGRVLPQLAALAGREPLNEHVYALLMVCLAASGQQAHALGVYEELRRRLDDELGVQPGPELAGTHLRVLRQEIPAQTPAPGPGDVPQAGPAVPQQLPAAVRQFTGRDRELAELSRLLAPDSANAGTMIISAIGGTAGVGKTALAVHWAHQVRDRFPDGQLYVNLCGHDPGQPVPAAEALAGFLRSLGVPGPDIPLDADQRAARYRSLLSGKRMLVVLDNAGSAGQVRPLLPGTPACTVLVTSRDALPGLVARDGAARLDLDLLPLADAVALLATLIGARAGAEPEATAELARQCCRLPLALRVAAELAASRPATPLAGLARELADLRTRLELLDAGGDPGTEVRAVFSWSYRHLDPGAARTFRLLGLHPGPDLDRYAAAALTAAPADQAGQQLGVLARAHLSQPADPGRHGLHDLLRAYARHLAAEHDPAAEQRAALTRLIDYYLHTAAGAMDTLVPAERDNRPRIPPPDLPAPPVDTPATARAWLDAERDNLVAITVHAAGHGWPGHATRLAVTLFRYLDTGGHYLEASAVHSCARRAARDTGDRAAEVTALNNLGIVDWRQGRYQQASDHYRQALALCRQTGDRTGAARALRNLGMVDDRQGRFRQATGHYRQALPLCRETGDRPGEAAVLGNLGIVDLQQGRYEQATSYLQQAMVVFRETGNRLGEAVSLDNLGLVDQRQGRYQQATSYHEQALALFREIGDRSGQGNTLNNLGQAGVRQGRYWQAASDHEQALALFRDIGDQTGEAEALNGLGEVLLAAGQEDRARHHWQEALALYSSLGSPEAGQVKARLAAVDTRDR
jgi:DNA-binding SARP family transcriptional activator/tetratricopeptide (TPR) repeat protein/DNA-binding XRE family transcriptional regulator